MDNLVTLEEKCGSQNNMIGLASFSTGVSFLTMIFAIPLNSFIIVTLITENKKKNLIFFKIFLSLAAADLVTGLVVCPSSVNNHLKEALLLPLSTFEVYLFHISLFFADAVALIALTFLSLDRLFCIVVPIKYFKGLNKKFQTFILMLPWPLGALLVLPYFEFQFIRQLAFYTGINISVAIISLVATYIGTHYAFYKKSSVLSKECTGNTSQSASQSRITKTFQRLIVVFIIVYLPTVVAMTYMNVCQNCDCDIVHVMRDISLVSLLLSSFLRPIVFIWSLTCLSKKFLILFDGCFFTALGKTDQENHTTTEVFVIGSTSSENESK